MSLELEQEVSLKEQFEALLVREDKLEIQEFLNKQNISDVAELVYEFPDYESQMLANMSVHRAVSVFKIIDLPTQKEIIKELPPFKTAELLNELPADDRTSFLEELPSSVVRELIKLLNPEERKITLSLLGYPENSMGRLMTPDYVYIYPYNTVAEVFDTIRKYGKDSETINVLYIINEKGELIDDIRIRDIILAAPDKRVEELIDGRFVALNVFDDQETANEAFKMNNRDALPVVSNTNKLLGIVTIDDVLWVANEEFSEDMQKMGGTAALDEPYIEIPIFKLFQKRVVWLIVLFFGELLTIWAMQGYEDDIAKVVILATFIPLIISSGGNSGSQAATLIIQALALGEISIADWWRILRRELISGMLLGTSLCLIAFSVIFIWSSFSTTFGDHAIRIGLTVGCSLIGIVLWGTLMGSMLPLLLKKFGADPATSSTPFVATLVDVTGLLIYFSMAYLFLSGVLL
jgi:magnesium transporter